MLKALKAIHIVGVALFLGSIFAHIATGQTPAALTEPAATLFSRQAIDIATRYVTVPGLAIVVISGILMVAIGYPNLLKRGWLVLHAAVAAIIVVITITVMLPAGRDILTAAAALASGAGTREAFDATAMREHSFGAANIVLALAAIVLGAVKPRLRRPVQGA
jgi:hypothetical protein